MTRLELVQGLARFLGTEEPDNITSTTAPADEYQSDLVTAIDTAYEEIQTMHVNWLWRRRQGTLTTAASDRDYAFSDVNADCVDVLPFVGGDMNDQYWLIGDHEVCYVPYLDFRGVLDRGTRQSNKPDYFTIQPDRTIEFDPTPDAVYTVELDWLDDVHELTADATEPEMPARFHKTVMYKAAIQMAEYDENMVRLGLAKERYQNLMNELRRDQLPQVDVCVSPVGSKRFY